MCQKHIGSIYYYVYCYILLQAKTTKAYRMSKQEQVKTKNQSKQANKSEKGRAKILDAGTKAHIGNTMNWQPKKGAYRLKDKTNTGRVK